MATTTSWVSKRPDRYGGDACVRDTRIPVWVLANYRRLGAPDAEILRSYPSLTPADLEAAWEYAAAHTACQQYRQVVVIVAVAVTDAGAVHHHALVQQCPTAFRHCLKAFEQMGELRDVKAVDRPELGVLGRVAAVVRQVVVAVRHAR